MYPNLKLQLWRMGIRQNRLAQIVGVDETILSRVVNGFRKASPELQRNIARALESSQEWLFTPVDPDALTEKCSPKKLAE